MPCLLVVDDEPSILHAFGRAFSDPQVKLLTANTGSAGIACALDAYPDVIVLDVNLPDMSGLEVFERIHKFSPKIPVIFITGHGTTDTAIDAIKLGALDYLFKPFELDELRSLVNRAFEISRHMRVPAVISDESSEAAAVDILVGRCSAMKDVYKAIGEVAPQHVTVLVQGESGTGKELVSRAIYSHSQRADRSFLTINCAAIPETLLESELFGHEQGAFTGADRLRIGKFEQCSGGTLFLDEVGDMQPSTQAKVLRFLQEQTFERVGGNETIKSDVRLIAATNHHLNQLVDMGRFRKDLYYRLSVFAIRLPPLRDRGEDVAMLCEHFLRRFARELNSNIDRFSDEALEALRYYSWPGNVRELENVIKQSLLQATGQVLLADFLPAYLRPAGAAPQRTATSTAPGIIKLDHFVAERLRADTDNLYAEALQLMENQLIAAVLRHTKGNRAWAARILGLTRNTLRSKIQSLGLDDLA
jgi:nitrogen regulation protein NR(I)